MQKIIWYILILLSINVVSAQCDSELAKIDAGNNDTLKVRQYRKIIDCYYHADDFESANKLFNKVKQTVERIILKNKDSLFYRGYLADLTTYYFYKGEIAQCLNISNQLLNYDFRNSDSVEISGTLGNIGILYRKEGNYPKALYFLQEAIKINEKLKRKELAGNYANLANLYTDIGKTEKAKEFFLKALQLRLAQKDEKGIALSYSNLANYFAGVRNFDSAIFYYSKAIFLNERTNVPESKKAITYNNYTGLFVQQNKLDSALKYLNITGKLINEKSNPFILAHFYENKGDINKHLAKYKDAIASYNLSEMYSKQNEDYNRLSTLYLSKSTCYYFLRNIDSTYYYRGIADKMKDSLFSTSKTAEITRYEMQYQFDKEQDALKTAQLKKEIETKHDLERKQFLIYASLVALVLLMGLVLMVLKNNHQKKKDNILLQQKNDLILSQKKDIIDSINYAKNLQTAILPPLDKIKQELGDGFIYYKPKDIIAGDFYWLHKTHDKNTNNEIFLFAVADCTGHGVPGALVSVVCSNALDSAVKEYGLVDPGKILDKTKELVLSTFSKTGQSIKDGMDISLCAFHRGLSTNGDSINIKWAGANNSLWYVHNNELKELIADKQPIGLSEKNSLFTTQTLELTKGDMLYFSTDGFYDQFGGDKSSLSGKKFMRKRLAQLFFNISNQSMEEQLKAIDETFNNWKGKLEQIDDVCIAGIKL